MIEDTIIEAFRCMDLAQYTDLQAWTDPFQPERQKLVHRIVRYILLVLQYTSIDKKSENLLYSGS